MGNADNRPLRILHVLGALNRGGVGTWLMHMLRRLDRQHLACDFLVETTAPAAYDEEVRALGGRVFPCPHVGRPGHYARELGRVLREEGPYDAVHSHVHHFSGFVLRVAQQAGVPVRLAHSHSDTRARELRASLLRRLYLRLTEHWVGRYATGGLACSRLAAESLFGRRWEVDPRWRLLYSAVDLTPFETPVNPAEVRAELGIPPGAFVVGHVGRLAPAKNHRFLLKIVAELARREPATHLLLVGEGPLREAIVAQAEALGLGERVTCTGARPDVPRLLLGAMDVVVFPSRWEGLPVTGLEVQAAGLPFVMSDVITAELDEIPELIRRLSLEQPPAEWAETVLRLRETPPPLSPTEAQERMACSRFTVEHSLACLQEVYHGR